MRKNASLVYPLVLVSGDFLALLTAFTIAYIARVSLDPRPLIEPIPALEYIKLFAALMPFWLLIFAGLGLYSKAVYTNRWRELWRLGVGSFVGMLFIVGYDFADNPAETIFPARLVAVYAFLLGFSLLALERQILWQLKKLFYRYGVGVERVMLVGSSEQTAQLANRLGDTKTSGYYIVAIVGGPNALPKGYERAHFGSVSQAMKQLPSLGLDAVIQTKLYESDSTNEDIQKIALANHLDYKLILAEQDYVGASTRVELFQGSPILHMSPTPLLGWGRVVKRLFDTFFSLLGLVILSPLLLLMSILILVFDFGPIFFRQTRLTRWGKEVRIFKFRTMKAKYSGRDDKEVFTEMGRPHLYEEFKNNRWKLNNDPRVTPLGRFMRRFSIDELPQLFNVLAGQISLVGPRGLRPKEAEQLMREKTPLILSVKSGVTGLAQVSGRSEISLEERIGLDQYYVQNWTIWLDVKILFKTIGTVLTRRGAE